MIYNLLSAAPAARAKLSATELVGHVSKNLFELAFAAIKRNDFALLSAIGHSKDEVKRHLEDVWGIPDGADFATESLQLAYARLQFTRVLDHTDPNVSFFEINEELATKIKSCLAPLYNPFDAYNRAKVDMLSPIYLSRSTPIADQHVALMCGMTPHNKAPGFLNIHDMQPCVKYNPFTAALLSHQDSSVEYVFRYASFMAARAEYYRENAPELMAIESVAYQFFKISDRYVKDSKRIINELGVELSTGKAPAQYMTPNVKSCIEKLSNATSFGEISVALASQDLPDYLNMAFSRSSDINDNIASISAATIIATITDTALFNMSLLAAVDNACSALLQSELTVDDRKSHYGTIERILLNYSDSARIACADIGHANLRRLIRPEQMMGAGCFMPLTDLLQYAKENDFDEHTANLMMCSAMLSIGDNTDKAVPYEQMLDDRADTILDILQIIEEKCAGSLNTSVGKLTLNALDEKFYILSDELFIRLAKSQSEKLTDMVTGSDSNADSQPLPFMNNIKL